MTVTHQWLVHKWRCQAGYDKRGKLVHTCLPGECHLEKVNQEPTIHLHSHVYNGPSDSFPSFDGCQLSFHEDINKCFRKVNGIPDAQDIHVGIVVCERPQEVDSGVCVYGCSDGGSSWKVYQSPNLINTSCMPVGAADVVTL